MNATMLATLTAVHRLPFADAGEITLIEGLSERSVYRNLNQLNEEGLIARVPRGTPTLPQSDRHFPMYDGIRVLAGAMGVPQGEIVRQFPVSAEWLENLAGRVDTVATVYRVAATSAMNVEDDSRVRVVFHRSGPLDAVITMPDGCHVGLMRQGLIAPRRTVTWRIGAIRRWTLDRGPRTILGLAQTQVDANRNWRQANRDLGRPEVYAYSETEALLNGDDRQKQPSVPSDITDPFMSTVDFVWAWARRARQVPAGDTVWRARATLPKATDIVSGTIGLDLKPSEIQAFNVIAQWQGISLEDVTTYLGVTRQRVQQLLEALVNEMGLVHDVGSEGSHRYAPTYDGLRYWTAGERSDPGHAFRKWGTDAGGRVKDWEGSSVRTLMGRESDHTQGLHHIVTQIAHAMRNEMDAEFLWSLPTHRNRLRFFWGGYKSLSPDATVGIVRNGHYVPLLIEYERSAVHPALARTRLKLYQALWRTSEPKVVHGVNPWILFIFPSETNEKTFVSATLAGTRRLEMKPPILTSNRVLLEQVGVTGMAWHYLWDEDDEGIREVLPTSPP